MNTIRRFIAGSLLALVGALALGGGAAPQALAAGGLVIDDAGDGTQCPGGLNITDLSVLGVSSGQTITICSGNYTGPLHMTSVTNVRIIGKGSPRIMPPSGGDGPVVDVTTSANVTIQGLYIDGADAGGAYHWSPSATNMLGIQFYSSTGTISKNYISRMRRQALSGDQTGEGISVQAGFGATTYKVKIMNNSIVDYQYRGIEVDGGGSSTITKNVLYSTVNGGPDRAGIYMIEVAGGSITGNTIGGDWSATSAGYNTGIGLYETQNVKVASNIISGHHTGIDAWAEHWSRDLTGNTISGNKIRGAVTGIILTARVDSNSIDDVSVSTNKVTGNTVIEPLQWGDQGIVLYISIPSASFMPSTLGNTIKGNTVLGYAFPVSATDTDPTHNATTPNKTGVPLPGQ